MDSDSDYDDLKWAEVDRLRAENKIIQENIADGKQKGEEDGIQAGFDDQFLKSYRENLEKFKLEKLKSLAEAGFGSMSDTRSIENSTKWLYKWW